MVVKQMSERRCRVAGAKEQKKPRHRRPQVVQLSVISRPCFAWRQDMTVSSHFDGSGVVGSRNLFDEGARHWPRTNETRPHTAHLRQQTLPLNADEGETTQIGNHLLRCDQFN